MTTTKKTPFIVGLGGTVRANSSTERALRIALEAAEEAGARTLLFSGAEIDLPTAQQVLKNIIETQEKKVTIEQIQKRVGEHFGLRAQDLKVRSNSKVIAFPRQVAMFLARDLLGMQLVEIGQAFGGRDHSTVIHSLGKVERDMESDRQFKERVELARRELAAR